MPFKLRPSSFLLSQCCINCHGPVNLQANLQSLNNQINVTHGPWCNPMLKCFFPLLTPRSMVQPGPTCVWMVCIPQRTSTRKTEQKVTVILYENSVGYQKERTECAQQNCPLSCTVPLCPKSRRGRLHKCLVVPSKRGRRPRLLVCERERKKAKEGGCAVLREKASSTTKQWQESF